LLPGEGSAMSFPFFRYYPDPISTGSVELSDNVCRVCGRCCGFIYKGPVYGGHDELVDAICPWCIFEGTAHEKFDVEFNDPRNVGGHGGWDAVPSAVVEEVAYRTPSFIGWQQERWFTHCGDAAEFLAIAGRQELEDFGDDAIAAIRQESGYDDEQWQSYFRALDRDHGPTAYVFRCRHCGKLGGYSDCH
jgi:uncharacterized protein